MTDGKVPPLRLNSIMKILFLSPATGHQRKPETIYSMANCDPKKPSDAQSSCVYEKLCVLQAVTVVINGAA